MALNIRKSLPQIARISSELCGYRSLKKIFLRSPIFAYSRITRKVSSSSNKSSTSTLSPTEKSPYEIELEKLQEQEKRSGGESHGFFDDEPVLDKVLFHGIMFAGVSCFCAFTIAMSCYTPMFKGDDKLWKYREARWLIRERREKGLPLISRDYAPKELIENMVPPPGEWEREWLSNQPTTKPLCCDWYGQNNIF